MTSGAARITAGYDDGPQAFEFAVAASRDVGPPPVDREAIGALASNLLAEVCRTPASVKIAEGATARLGWWRRGDGLVIGLGGGGATLASALVNRDCGGEFRADDAGNGSASVERQRGALLARLRIGVAALWPAADDDWVSCPPVDAEAFSLRIEAGLVRDQIDCAVQPPPEAVAPLDTGWRNRLSDVLDSLAVPVQLVLHEAAITVGAARAIAVGDVLPIATAHEVGLRVGALTVARGRIANDGELPRVEITSRARASTCPSMRAARNGERS
ncbi:FliM/FliN family flagellar motor switch protein [Glacieibacterium sp.]|uniref:FliM/FliN family flagellar motor switch protein n=1 Tax=Glacieibacterium sp. TaxID=2860237 RepID=UPI003AFFA777